MDGAAFYTNGDDDGRLQLNYHETLRFTRGRDINDRRSTWSKNSSPDRQETNLAVDGRTGATGENETRPQDDV